jgi:hypothetical protein
MAAPNKLTWRALNSESRLIPQFRDIRDTERVTNLWRVFFMAAHLTGYVDKIFILYNHFLALLISAC